MTARRTEPSAWLCPPAGQARLQYMPAARTDIRALFARVRASQRRSALAVVAPITHHLTRSAP